MAIRAESARSEATEPKQRKAAAGGAPAPEAADAVESSDKDLRERSRRALQSLPPALQRRRTDAAGLLAFATIVVVGTYVTTQEMLQPPESQIVRVASPVLGALLALFLLSWLGVAVHGPGRPPLAGAEAEPLPEVVAAALQAGQRCKKSPFDAKGTACGECGMPPRSSSVFFTHCKDCNQCSFMMDSHMPLVAQCVGYRNLRCFLVWLGYGQAILLCLVGLSARRLLDTGLPSVGDFGAVVRHGGWCAYLWMCFVLFNNSAQRSIVRTAAGWPSKVMWAKFNSLHCEAKALAAQLDREDCPDADRREASRLLREAAAACYLSSLRVIAGPFVSAKPKLAIEAVMGGPFSWRWLLPLVPSGESRLIGQCPEQHSVAVCQAWERLGQLVVKAEGVLASSVNSPRPGRRCKTPGFQQAMV